MFIKNYNYIIQFASWDSNPDSLQLILPLDDLQTRPYAALVLDSLRRAVRLVVHLTYWGNWIRTSASRYQKPLPYHLATPQSCDIKDAIRYHLFKS